MTLKNSLIYQSLSRDLRFPQSSRAIEILKTKARYVGVNGGFGCGKTIPINVKIYLACCQHPNLRVLIVRPERVTLYDTIIPDFDRIILEYGIHDDRNPFTVVGGKEPKSFEFQNGSQILFRGMDKLGNKMRGGFYDIIFYNQLELGEPEHVVQLESRLRNYKQLFKQEVEEDGKLVMKDVPYSQFIFDCNPGGPRHWLLEWINELGVPVLNFWLDDNPRWFWNGEWTDEGIDYYNTLSGFTGTDKDRFLYGHWVAQQGLVYKDFSLEKHVRNYDWSDIPKNWDIFTARDYGTTVESPFVHSAFAVSPDRKKMRELPECQIYLAEIGITEMIENLKRVESLIYQKTGKKVKRRVSDHDGLGQLEMRKAGFPAVKGKKDIIDGISQVKVWLNGDRCLFLPDNKSLSHERDPKLKGRAQQGLDEWFLYEHRSQQQQERSPEKADLPIKKNDHYLDTVRYLIMMLNKGGPIRSEGRSLKSKKNDSIGVRPGSDWI